MLRSPSNPRLLAPLPEHRTNGGAAPEPPRQCAQGAAAHRCGRRRPHPGGAGRLRPGRGGPPAPPMPGSGPPRPSAASASCRPASASASRTAPPTEALPTSAWTRRRRAGRLPAGINRARGAGWERPRTRQKGRQKPPVAGPSIPRMEGGRSQPRSPAKTGERQRRGWAEGQRGQGLSGTAGCAGSGKSSGKRWVLSFCRNMPTPKAAQRANKGALGPGVALTGRRWTAALRLPVPRRVVIVVEGQLIPVTAAVVPMAARRAAVRRCDTFRSLPPRIRLAVPGPAARCAREWSKFPPLPSLIRDCRAVEEVAPDVTSVFRVPV